MNIVLASDNNFVQHCAVTMISVLNNNHGVHFYLLTEGLSEDNCSLLNDLVVNNGGRLDILIVTSDILKRVPMPQGIGFSHISVATYYRLFVASILPNTIDKIIYLDCDIVVRGDLSELDSLDMHGKPLAAVFQDDPLLLQGDEEVRLGIGRNQGYFNAGVLVINLSYWRNNNIERVLLDFIENNYSNIKFHDQDTLNAVLGPDTICLNCKWNMLSIFLSKALYAFTSERCVLYRQQIVDGAGKNPSVVHFVSRPKPWEWTCSHPYKRDYYYYLDKTPFTGWRPKPQWTFYNIKEKYKNSFPFRLLPVFNDSGIFIKF